jgi:glycyl-tRNA synthetase alpha subunit
VVKYGDVRLADELQFSVYNFELADVEKAWKHFDLCEAECKGLLEKYAALGERSRRIRRRGIADARERRGFLFSEPTIFV